MNCKKGDTLPLSAFLKKKNQEEPTTLERSKMPTILGD